MVWHADAQRAVLDTLQKKRLNFGLASGSVSLGRIVKQQWSAHAAHELGTSLLLLRLVVLLLVPFHVELTVVVVLLLLSDLLVL